MGTSAIDASSLATLREVLGNDGLKMTIASYTENTPKLIEQLHSSLSQEDWKELARAAHTIKGSSSNYGADRLVEVSLKAELQAKEENGDNMAALIAQVETEYQHVYAALQAASQ